MSDEEAAAGLRAFFNAMRDNFALILAQGAGDPRLVDVLAAQAGDNYEKNAEIQSEGLPSHACGKGCETCCCLQVAATAPEIFHAAHFIRLTSQAFAAHGVDLAKRLREARNAIAGQGHEERFASRRSCPASELTGSIAKSAPLFIATSRRFGRGSIATMG